MNTPAQPLMVACPCCGKRVIYSTQNNHRPFCSERCQQIDFGNWASESFRLPVQEPDPDPTDPAVPGVDNA